MIYTVKDVRFTHGSPFGEQYWTLTDSNGVDHQFAMWMDFKSPKWARTGEKVEIERTRDLECHVGHGSKLYLRNCAEIIKVIR